MDLSAFDELYHQYHHAVYSNIRKLVREDSTAEDILQEVFLALWEYRHKLDAGKVAGWLFVTSYNKSIKHLKKKVRENTSLIAAGDCMPEPRQEEPVREDLYHFRVSLIEDAVSHLPERKRQVFTLCRYEGKSFDEVARIMDISPGSVKDYLKQSNRFIREYIFSNYTEASLAIAPLLLLCQQYFS